MDNYARFDAWREKCLAARTRPIPYDKSNFEYWGFEKMRVMSAADAVEILAEFGKYKAYFYNAEPNLSFLKIDDKALARRIMNAILGPQTDCRLYTFFGCEYLVKWFSITEVKPTESPGVSFLWHIDQGPEHHVKAILYLNGTSVHGGRTDFIPTLETLKLADAGYMPDRLEDREADLTKYILKAGLQWASSTFAIEAGEMVLFKPRAVYHRGVMPTSFPRYAVQACFLPSPEFWAKRFETGDLAALHGVEADGWDVGEPVEVTSELRTLA